jgi:hypothetical protein
VVVVVARRPGQVLRELKIRVLCTF